MTGKLTCRHFIEFLDDYVAGSMDAEMRGRFEGHLDRCPPCRDYLRTYRDTVRLAGEACRDDDEVPEDVPEDLIQAILKARKG